MSKANTVTININAGGNTAVASSSFNSDFAAENSPDEVAAFALTGSLTTRTSATAGIVTSASHTITGLVICVFWTGGYRVDVDVDSSDTNTITFSGGSGDDLPDEDTAVYVSERLQVDTLLNGANLSLLCLKADQSFLVSVLDSSDVSQLDTERNAGDAYLWYSGAGDNPLVAITDIAKINFYNRSLTTDANVSAIYAYDNTLDQI